MFETILTAFLTAVLALGNATLYYEEPQKDYYYMELDELLACEELTPVYGYVVEQTYEGWSEYDDYYIVDLNGYLYEIMADDLRIGDRVTCYFYNGYIVRTLYEWR